MDINLTVNKTYNFILIILIIFIFPEHVMYSIEKINLTQIPSLEEIELLDKDAAVVCTR